MQAFRLSLIVVVLSLTGGCPTTEVEPGLVWNPTLNESGSGGELDLGTIAPSESTSGQIVVWNNTEDDVAFDVTCNLTEGGWIISCPTGERVIPPTEYDGDTGDPIQGTFLAVGPTFQSPAESDYDGTIAFAYDNRIVTYVVRVSVVAEE
jgi:hypothetical protein